MSTHPPNQRPVSAEAGQIEAMPPGTVGAAIRRQYTAALQPLIRPSTIQTLDGLTRHLPQAITSFWGYELPLGGSGETADFLLCIHKPDALCRAFDTPAGLQVVIPEPVFGRLRELAHRWADPRDRVGRLISNIWLEYDYADLQTGRPCPNFFYGPKGSPNPLEVVWASRQVLELVSPGGLPGGTFRFLLRCLIQLEGQGWVSQIGRMLARNENRLRLFIQQIPPNGILPYLRRVAYPQAEDQRLAEQLDRCYQLADRVDLDIDITDKIGSSVGLECYFDTMEKALFFLADLVERGLCLPEQYELLVTCLSQIRPLPETDLQPLFSHVKLVYRPVGGFTAKVYMGYVDREIAHYVIRTQPLATP